MKILLFLFFTTIRVYSAPTNLILTQKEVTRLVVETSHKAHETTLKYQQLRLTPLQKLSVYDWTLSAESGYEWDRNEGPLHPSSLTNQTYKTNIFLKKNLITGTNLSFEYSRKSLYGREMNLLSKSINQYTFDLLGLTVEQNLWRNAFGTQDRAELESAELIYQANSITRASELQDLVLESLRLYWNTYVAQENFSEALASRDRYQRFVNELKRKTAYGYSNNYELYQIEAELENREQLIKTNSLEYLKNLDLLSQLINLPQETNIQFPKIETIPDIPNVKIIYKPETRTIKSQSFKIKAAEADLNVSRSQDNPILSLNGSLYGSGFDELPSLAESHLLSGAYPKYYIGLKFIVQFGSGYGSENILSKKAALELEQQKYQRLSEELQNNRSHVERKVQTTFYSVESTKKQLMLREKTTSEMQKSFNNGRIDISLLIDSMNKLFNLKVQYIRAIGDYFITLNEWAALNDELILNPEVIK